MNDDACLSVCFIYLQSSHSKYLSSKNLLSQYNHVSHANNITTITTYRHFFAVCGAVVLHLPQIPIICIK